MHIGLNAPSDPHLERLAAESFLRREPRPAHIGLKPIERITQSGAPGDQHAIKSRNTRGRRKIYRNLPRRHTQTAAHPITLDRLANFTTDRQAEPWSSRAIGAAGKDEGRSRAPQSPPLDRTKAAPFL